jgi:mersacidin/lichenicidin family type 2 lantibiotic
MTKDMIIRAWKDPAFRATLTAEQLAALPSNPAGLSAVELSETELSEAVGGLYSPKQGVSNASSCGYICTYTTECNCAP